MASPDERKKQSSGESVPLLQTQQHSNTAAAPPQQTYAATGHVGPAAGIPPPHYGAAVGYAGYGNPEIPVHTQATGSSYFLPSPGHYSIPPPQNQQSPMMVNSPNQQSQQLRVGGEGVGGSMPPPGPMPPPQYYYPFPPPQPGALPQYQYPIYPVQQQRQPSQTGPNTGVVPINTASHSPSISGNVPALNEIFDASGGKDSQPSGYGSIITSPRIYNAPIPRLPPSGRAQQPQVIKRTNSSGEVRRLQKGGFPNQKEHRRVHSDAPLRMNRMHLRANTDESLPPRGSLGHNRARSLSSGSPLVPRGRHRRIDSASSYHSMGGGSFLGSIADSSQISMRSNIAKSSLFAGVDQEGRPLLYYPYESIRLVMVPDRDQGKRKDGDRARSYHDDSSEDDTAEQEAHLPLKIGHLYADEPVNVEDYYEDYHRVSDELEQGLAPQWESLEAYPLSKNKGSLTQEDRKGLLPPTNYVVAVSDDIYKRMFAEVSDAMSLPCGLFFCGHHEDVDTPSALIPTTLVIILFSTLLYLSYVTEDFYDIGPTGI